MGRQLDEALEVLGVPADSDRASLTSAYRRLARTTHPDVSSDPEAAVRFATIAAAYRVVSDRLVSDVHRPAYQRGNDCKDNAASSCSFTRWPAQPPLNGAEIFMERGRPRVFPSVDVVRLLGVSPLWSSQPWLQPTLVAGPVVVRRVPFDAGRRSRDG